MKKSMTSFMNSTLTREEMRRMVGGESSDCRNTCSLWRQDDYGNWYGITGNCKVAGDYSGTIPAFTCYCEIGIGQKKLSSNGGESRCNL